MPFGGGAVAVELGGEDVGVARLKNPPVAGTGRTMAPQATRTLQSRQMPFHRQPTQAQSFREATGREGGFVSQMSQDRLA